LLEHRASGGVNDHQIWPQLTSASRQRHPIHAARQIDIRQQHIDGRARDVQKGISGVGYALDGKTLLRERLRDPLTDEELVFDEQDANSRSVRCICACVNAHGSNPTHFIAA
jgi:hypothetical protein